MGNLIDLTGKVFSRLTVVERRPNTDKFRQTFWFCHCICGNTTTVNSRHLREGNIQSCGCLNLEINSKRMKGNRFGYKHGYTDHPLRAIRKAMMHRCYNTNNRFYKNYGARGIVVCDEWKNSLESFINWSLANGWEKGLSVDRIDNDGPYSPHNCHWISVSANSSKKRSPEPQPRKKSVRNQPTPQI